MKTIIEILQEEKIDLNIVNNYRYDTLSSKEAKIIVNTLYSVLQCITEESEEQKQLLIEADSKVEALEACINSQVKAIDRLREENKIFKNGIDDYNKRIEETAQKLKELNKEISNQVEVIQEQEDTISEYKKDLESAEDKINTRDSAIEVIDEENKKLREELEAAKKACDTCSLIKLDTQYNRLSDENYALKVAYETKDNQVGELIKILSKLVND